ncbi:MAG: cytochrome c maturation protein CcmE [Silvanigrellaceae bacterium]|nr:cytochrome c maturation protein CcmE [Silvanigrellaceae bacterium]
MNKGQWVGFSVITCSLLLIGYQATKGESTVTFYTPAEVYQDIEKFDQKLFRVSGLVLSGSTRWKEGKNSVTFLISDLKGHDFTVHYKGIPPDLFKEGQGVVVEGRLSRESINAPKTKPAVIHATLLMVKHSEVYDTSTDHAELKEAKLLESILKHENLTPKTQQ